MSKAKFLSRLYEAFVCEWLLPHITPYLDPGQFGGIKGASTNHYLVKLLSFIHDNIDKRDPHAIVLAPLDLSKAYNRGSGQVLTDLVDMHVPNWLVSLIFSYMSGRSMQLAFNGAWPEIKKTCQVAFLKVAICSWICSWCSSMGHS